MGNPANDLDAFDLVAVNGGADPGRRAGRLAVPDNDGQGNRGARHEPGERDLDLRPPSTTHLMTGDSEWTAFGGHQTSSSS